MGKYTAVLETIKDEMEAMKSVGPMRVTTALALKREANTRMLHRHGEGLLLASLTGTGSTSSQRRQHLQQAESDFRAAALKVFKTEFVTDSVAGNRHTPRISNQFHLVGFGPLVIIVLAVSSPLSSPGLRTWQLNVASRGTLAVARPSNPHYRRGRRV